LPLPDALSPVESLSQEMLPEALKGWIMDIADRMQIPPDFSAASCIVVLSSLIGRKIGIYPKRKDDWLVIPNLWGAIVGRPSLLKSPAIAEIMKPLDKLLDHAFNQYQSKMAFYEQELTLLDAKKAAKKDLLKQSAKKAIKNRVSFNMEQFNQENDFQEIEKPILKRYKTEDSTVEKIGEILKDNPQGILIHRDELFGWLKSLDKYGREGDRAFYLEAWNGNGSFTVDRIGRGTLHIPALCLSILGGIQPGPLSSYIYQASKGGVGDDGLLQRFQLLVWPDAPKNWLNVDRFPDSEAKRRAYKIYQELDALPFQSQKQESEPNSLRFCYEAQDLFDEWRNKLEASLREGQLAPALESHLAKYRSLMPSLALTFYLIECIDQNVAPSTVSVAAANQAIKWCKYLESHMQRLYSSVQRPELESAKALMNKIKRGEIQNGCHLRDIYYGKHWMHLSNRQEVNDAVGILQDLGWLRVVSVATKGRPTQILQLHPSLKKM
jgi:putative DNA primase/helicase